MLWSSVGFERRRHGEAFARRLCPGGRPPVGRARDGPFSSRNRFDSACGSGTLSCTSTRRGPFDLLVEPLRARRAGQWSPTSEPAQGLLIHFRSRQDVRVIRVFPAHARRIGRQTMEERDFMFDAYNSQGWMCILQESVYVTIQSHDKNGQDGLPGEVAIMHQLRAKRDWDARQERSRRPRCPRFSEISPPHTN